MVVRKYVAVGWERLLIYGGILGMFLAALIAVFVKSGVPWQFRLITCLSTAATFMIEERLLAVRLDYEKLIAWYTVQGAAVLPGALKDWLAQRKTKLEQSIQSSLDWWAKQSGRDLSEVFNGFVFDIVSSDAALKDAQTGETARGFTYSDKTVLWYPESPVGVGEYLKGYAGREVEELFFDIVKHEAGHRCLDALGIPVEQQHQYMRDKGFPDA